MMSIEYQNWNFGVILGLLGFSVYQDMREILSPNAIMQSGSLSGRCWTVD